MDREPTGQDRETTELRRSRAGIAGLVDRRSDAHVFEACARSDSELGFDQIDTGDLLGDGVLDLNARVALDEEVVPGLGGHQELHRCCIRQASLRREPHGVGVEPVAQAAGQARRRGDLDDFLIALLDRAVPLPQVSDAPVLIGQYLHFDVARPVHEALHEHGAVAEGRRRLARASFERLSDVFDARHGAHAPAAAAGCRLQHHRQANLCGCIGCCSGVGDCGGRPSSDGNIERSGQGAGTDLVAEQFQRVCGRADEREPRLRARMGERGVLRQKAVAGVDAIAIVIVRDSQQCVDVQVRSQRIAARQRRGSVGSHKVQRAFVDRCVHRHRFDAQGIGGLGDPYGDLAAVGDQDTGEAHDSPSVWPLCGRLLGILARNPSTARS